MSVGASLRGGSDLALLGFSEAKAGAPARWAGTIALATALTGLLEVALFRVATPVLSHVPGRPGGSSVADAIRASGASALRATAVLAPLVIGVLAAASWRGRRGRAVLLYAAGAATVTASFAPGDALTLVAHAATVLVALAVVHGASREMPRAHALGVGLLAASFIAGRWPLVLDAVSGSGLTAADSTAMAGRTIAEAALVVAPVVLAVSVVGRGVRFRPAWSVAGVVGAAVALALALAPQYLAITSLWASNVTLSLPQLAYVIAAASLGLVIAEWSANRSTRHLAAGIALLAVAGITPAVVHHNLTAVAGLVLMASPSLAATPIPSEERT